MAFTKQEVIEIISSSPFGKWGNELTAKLRPAIKIIAQKNANTTLGNSRLGGEPDLPKEWIWPEHDRKPLEFILQVNIEELKIFDIENQLPSSGWLYFFCLQDDKTEEVNAGRVLYYDGPIISLNRKNSPAAVLDACEIRYELYYMLPAEDDDNSSFLEDLRKQIEIAGGDFFGMYEMLKFSIGQEKPEFDGPYSHMLGYFEPVQGNDFGEKDALLLQLQPDPSQYEKTWGDMGTLFYTLTQQDLQQKQFINAYVAMQTY